MKKEPEEDVFSARLDLQLWGRVFRHAFPYKRLLIPLAISAVAIALADASFALVTRWAVDDVAEEDHLSPRMAPDPALQAVAQLIQQPRQCTTAAMHITDKVVAAFGIKLHQSPPPRRLPQPSLVRQTS